MARTTISIVCKDVNSANQKIEKILTSHRYKQVNEKGEAVWKCGVGFWTAMKYIKVEVGGDKITLNGWIRPVIGPEQNLDGFMGGLPKKQVKKVIEEIRSAIK